MKIPTPAPVRRFSCGHSNDGEFISLVFECHDGKTRAVAIPHAALDEIVASLNRARVAAAKARGESQH
jgi:hypothetical protein